MTNMRLWATIYVATPAGVILLLGICFAVIMVELFLNGEELAAAVFVMPTYMAIMFGMWKLVRDIRALHDEFKEE